MTRHWVKANSRPLWRVSIRGWSTITIYFRSTSRAAKGVARGKRWRAAQIFLPWTRWRVSSSLYSNQPPFFFRVRSSSSARPVNVISCHGCSAPDTSNRPTRVSSCLLPAIAGSFFSAVLVPRIPSPFLGARGVTNSARINVTRRSLRLLLISSGEQYLTCLVIGCTLRWRSLRITWHTFWRSDARLAGKRDLIFLSGAPWRCSRGWMVVVGFFQTPSSFGRALVRAGSVLDLDWTLRSELRSAFNVTLLKCFFDEELCTE